MESYSDLLAGAKELSKISNGASHVKNFLDIYEKDNDLSYIFMSAWITRVAILDVIEKNNFPSYYSLFVTIDNQPTSMTISQVFLMTVTRIMIKASQNGDDIEKIASDIMDKKEAFYEFDNQIPYEQKLFFK